MDIEFSFEGPGFVAVPDRVVAMVGDPGLSPDAFGVLVVCAGFPKGSRASAASICKRFRFGKDRWQRIAGELRAVGALSGTTDRDARTGRMVSAFKLGWPEPSRTLETRHRRVSRPSDGLPHPRNPQGCTLETRRVAPSKPGSFKETDIPKGAGADLPLPADVSDLMAKRGEGPVSSGAAAAALAAGPPERDAEARRPHSRPAEELERQRARMRGFLG